MRDWSSGYVAEIDYTHGYFGEIGAGLLRLAVASRRWMVGDRRPLRYLELGFGQGLSLNIHAAACPGEYWGTDFNPGHAGNARDMAEAAGSGTRIFDLSFAELAARDDLPEFDVIALHGIWSWISAENRAVIVDLARRKLAVGGLFYVSYNCTPGWSPVLPLRNLMTLHAQLMGSEQGIARNIDAALKFAQQMNDSGARYFSSNPGLKERLEKLTKEDRNYLAHEYFNRDWAPMPFFEVAEILSGAKLEFAASANLTDHVEDINFPAAQQQLLNDISHPIFRESVRDFVTNAQFRKDVFIKDSRTVSPAEQSQRYRGMSFMLIKQPDSVPMKFQGAVSEINLLESIYKPLIEMLAEKDHAPKTVTWLEAHPAWGGKSLGLLIEALLVLTGLGCVHPVQDSRTIAAARPRCRALNSYLCERAQYGNAVSFLAAPVTGSGVSVPRFWQMFLWARQSGMTDPGTMAAFAWKILSGHGQSLVKDGKTLQTTEENLAELTRHANEFTAKGLTILKALGIAD